MGKYDYYHDLSSGGRQYLARKGIRGAQFDAMPTEVQKEWLDEVKDGYYAKNDKNHGTINAVPHY